MEMYLRPGRFSTDPSTVGADIEWIHWRTTFENFFETIQPRHSFCRSQENIKFADSIKLTLLINHVTPNVYKLFRGIETCEQVITHLNNIYSRSDNDISARYKLVNKKQQAGESLYAYVRSLRELANHCNFDVVCAEKNREDYIRDLFISGIVSNDIRKKLLKNSTLTLEEAVNQAAALELKFQTSNTAELPSNSQEPECNQHCNNSTIQEPQELSHNSAESSVGLPLSDDEDVQLEPEELPSPEDVVEGLKSNDAAVLLEMAIAARRILSEQLNPPISIMISSIITPLAKALDRDDCPDLQIEVSSALAEIARGSCERAKAVIASGVVPKLISLASAGGTVGEQCTRALGKIAGAGPEPQNLVLSSGALPAVIQSLKPGVPSSQLKAAAWTLCMLCKREMKPLVNIDLVAPALPYIADLLEVDDDEDMLSELCSTLMYLTDGPNYRIKAVQAVPNLLKKLLRLLDHPALQVQRPALRTVVNMLNGSKVQVDRCLDEGCLHYLPALLRHSEADVVENAAWALGNILTGTQPQIQRVIDYGILPHLLQVLKHHNSGCQEQAAYAVTNLCRRGSNQQLDALMALDFLEPYCNLLGSQDTATVNYVLIGINNLLQSANERENVKNLRAKLKKIGALDRIKSMQTIDDFLECENKQIRDKVSRILTYTSLKRRVRR